MTIFKLIKCISLFIFTEPGLLGPGGGYPGQYGPPDFHQSSDGWKGAPAHPGLIKDPPLSTRNAPNTFVNQGQPQVVCFFFLLILNDFCLKYFFLFFLNRVQ